MGNVVRIFTFIDDSGDDGCTGVFCGFSLVGVDSIIVLETSITLVCASRLVVCDCAIDICIVDFVACMWSVDGLDCSFVNCVGSSNDSCLPLSVLSVIFVVWFFPRAVWFFSEVVTGGDRGGSFVAFWASVFTMIKITKYY